MENIVASVGSLITTVIDTSGYAGIFILMVLEGSFIPIPSEIILPFSGYLAAQGRFSIWLVALAGAVGNIVGTLITYSISRYIGLPFLYRYGKYVLVTRHDIDLAHRLFQRYGVPMIFISRLMPGIRGFIPIPAGVAQMRLIPFISYVFVGSFLWSLFLTYIGFVIGEHWMAVQEHTRGVQIVLLVIVVLGGVWWIWRHISLLRKETNNYDNDKLS